MGSFNELDKFVTHRATDFGLDDQVRIVEVFLREAPFDEDPLAGDGVIEKGIGGADMVACAVPAGDIVRLS